MKAFILSMTLGLITNLTNAQRVGIGTTFPLNSLDVRGSVRFGGNSNYLKYDSATGKFEWIGASLFVPASQQIISHSATAEGLYAGGGKLEYRNTTDPVFFSDWNTGNGYFAGNLGIGNTAPLAKLHIMNGSSGGSAPSSNLLVESSGNNYMSFLSPDGSSSAIWFSKPSASLGGGIF